MAYASLHLGDVHVNAKGARMAPLTDAGENPSGPNHFDKDASAPRQNLEVRVTGEAASYFRGLDAWAED
jgi:hypothetical protein